MNTPTPEQVLNLPMGDNDAGAATIRDYLTKLLKRLRREQDCFSGKSPFGNSSWEFDLYSALVEGGLVFGGWENGNWSCDRESADRLIAEAIEHLGQAPAIQPPAAPAGDLRDLDDVEVDQLIDGVIADSEVGWPPSASASSAAASMALVRDLRKLIRHTVDAMSDGDYGDVTDLVNAVMAVLGQQPAAECQGRPDAYTKIMDLISLYAMSITRGSSGTKEHAAVAAELRKLTSPTLAPAPTAEPAESAVLEAARAYGKAAARYRTWGGEGPHNARYDAEMALRRAADALVNSGAVTR